MRATLLAGAILTAASLPAAAGPWARGEGDTFLALSYETTVDPDDPFLELSHEILVYGERGLNDRLTLVLDGGRDITGDDQTLMGLLNWSLADPGATHQFAVAAGLGSRQVADRSVGFPVLAASWGRGFTTRWGGGWTTVEAQYRAASGFDRLAKLDLTLGLRPSEKSLVFGQIRLSDAPGSDPAARFLGTLVLDVTRILKAELGFLYGIENDPMVGLRSGFWLDF